MVLPKIKIIVILLVLGVLGFFLFKYFFPTTGNLFNQKYNQYKNLNDWCLNSEYWFMKDTCGGYVSTDLTHHVFLDKSGKYKGDCGWEDNSCPYKGCMVYSNEDQYTNLCLQNVTSDYCKNVKLEDKRDACYKEFSPKPTN